MNVNDKFKVSGALNRREFIKRSGGAAMLLADGILSKSLFAGGEKRQSNDTPENILLILTDQQYIDTIAAAGCPYVKTPALDQLKKHGFYFSQSHSTNPVCSPARSSIFTGRMPSETGVYKNGLPIRTTIPNLGQWFSQKTDFETVYAGKWHLPGTSQRFIDGFTVLTGMIGGQGNVWDTYVSRACEGFLWNRSKEKPFLLVASFMQPHDICEWLRLNTYVPGQFRYPEISSQLPALPDNFNYDPNEPESVKNKRKDREGRLGNWTEQHWRYYRWSYFRHIEMVDAEIGRILKAIKDAGYANDTVIVFTSDHGEGLGHHQMVRKSILYEQGVKVPLLISWPGHIPEDQADDIHLVSGIDIMPTLCDYAGIEPPEHTIGTSLRPLLDGSIEPWRDYIVSEVSSNTGRMVRTEQYKYIVYNKDPVEQLFDMQNDPGETENLAPDSQFASILTEHRNMLKEWESKLDVAPDVPATDAWWYGSGTGIQDGAQNSIPGKFELHQNYPNPFNPSTRIKFEIAHQALVDINIYNLNGGLVETLVREQKSAGSYTIEWRPQGIASGLYVCIMKAADNVFTHKMMYLK